MLNDNCATARNGEQCGELRALGMGPDASSVLSLATW